jgi:diguanylate cyclase (GGDEF)-like protein
MMLFDLRTVSIIAGIMAGLMACVFFAAHHSFPKSVGGLKQWGIANISFVFAGIGISFRDILPDFLSIVVANVFFVVGYWLMWSATRELLNVPNISPVVSRSTIILITLLLLFWTYASPNFAARAALMAGIACIYYMSQAISLWRRHKRSIESNFFIFLMLAGFGVTLARVVTATLLVNANTTTSNFTPTFIQSLYITTLSILALLHNMAFFFLATRKLQSELQKVARNDPLTGIFNRRAMTELAEIAVEHAKRKGHSLSVIVCDLDKFKLINDTHGHDVGDKVLCDFSQIVSAQKRSTDIFARLGGEEFILIMQEADQTQATAVCNRIHSQLNTPRNVEFPAYTSSFGISTSTPKTTPEISAADIITCLVKRADEAVYAAKKNGRNRIEVALV